MREAPRSAVRFAAGIPRPTKHAPAYRPTHVRQPDRQAQRRVPGPFRTRRISEENVREAMKEVRTALLEADVSFKVVREFTENVVQKAIGRR